MTNIRIHLQQQYNKLQSRIHKAIKSGKFSSYTAYKQQQLKSRLQRYALQMRQLATGVAVCAALGVAVPASAQLTPYNLIQYTSHPVIDSTLGSPIYYNTEFVDIDGDGDLDCFKPFWDNSILNRRNIFFENIGNVSTPLFTRRNGSDNPLDAITGNKDAQFVDIDNDGDYDLFMSSYTYKDTSEQCYFYLNVGSSTNPSFVLQTPAQNPLDSVNVHCQNLNLQNFVSPCLSFVDIDNDGDMDAYCQTYEYFFGNTISSGNQIMFYENQGTASVPDFRRQYTADPFSPAIISALNCTAITANRSIRFHDFDYDGDYDAQIIVYSDSTAFQRKEIYFENQGTASSPTFVYSSTTPIDSSSVGIAYDYIDLDDDLDLDIIASSNYYFENQDTLVANTILDEPFPLFVTYPNPSNGIINFEKALTGSLKIYNISGQEVYAKELEEAQTLNVAQLESGLFFMVLQTAKERIRTTVLIER